MWKHLQRKKLYGKKFRRQHSIESFIVDFYCASEKLIIELDGEVHLNPTSEQKDENRDMELNELGYKVLRFENQMVFHHLESVLQEIRDNFKY